MKKKLLLLLSLMVLSALLLQFKWGNTDDKFVYYAGDPSQVEIAMYLKNNSGTNYGSIGNLKSDLHKQRKKLIFATNGGMYKKDKSPQGLFIQDGIVKNSIDTADGDGNFYMKPNGVFYVANNSQSKICTTQAFSNTNVKYATQSGPMLVIDGEIHSAFKKGSTNLNIRSGVGILPDGQAIFAMSKEEINFYDFAEFFRSKGCKNALYLDGFVSRAYCPSQNWIQTDGDFGVIIGITKK